MNVVERLTDWVRDYETWLQAMSNGAHDGHGWQRGAQLAGEIFELLTKDTER